MLVPVDVRLMLFFFQAEDGIRDLTVTGVQTCALPIYLRNFSDRSGFSFLLDNVHWLPSSVVNAELESDRPMAQAVDNFVERCLDLQEEIGRASCRERV